MKRGLLIVNADDWGGTRATRTASTCASRRGAISSASALVFFPDSERAARIVRKRGRPIGLHLNLTEEPAGGAVPADVRERHDRVRAHFADYGSRRWRYDPRIGPLVDAVISDQLQEFLRLYGGSPTHVDSHHHVHVSPDVFMSGTLPQGLPVRTTLCPRPGARRSAWTVASRAKRAVMAAGYTTPARFWSLPQLHPELGGDGIERALRQSRRRVVEIMCHPSFDAELPLLLSPDWLDGIAPYRLGSYADLAGSRVPTFAKLAEPLADYAPLVSAAPL